MLYLQKELEYKFHRRKVELPQSYITSLKVDNQSEAVDVFIERFPTITSVDLEAALDQIRVVLDTASTAVQYIFLLSLLAGVLTLIASIFSTVEERNKENAVMKAMGAKQRDILQIALAEFGALGLVASITSLFVAIGFSAYVSTQIFETSYTPNGTESTATKYDLATDGYTDNREQGRQFTYRVESGFDQYWEIGSIRAEVSPGGRR